MINLRPMQITYASLRLNVIKKKIDDIKIRIRIDATNKLPKQQ